MRNHFVRRYGRLLRCIPLLVALALFLIEPLPAWQLDIAGSWDGWHFLLGEWIGEGGGDPGQGVGMFSFSLELQNKVLVRRNHSEYPASKNKAAYSHDDLMVIYNESGKLQAMYFDNEAHVIHYAIEFNRDSTSVVFLSDPTHSGPRFRLSYTTLENDKVEITCDIAPPGKPDEFARYIQATARRKK